MLENEDHPQVGFLWKWFVPKTVVSLKLLAVILASDLALLLTGPGGLRPRRGGIGVPLQERAAPAEKEMRFLHHRRGVPHLLRLHGLQLQRLCVQ